MADVLDFEVRVKAAEEDINKLNAQLRSIANNAEHTGDQMDDAFKKVGKTIGAVFATSRLIAFGKQVVNVRKEIEAYEISFSTLLGSQEKADALFGSLREFAVKTPMQLGDLAKGAQTLLGFGIEAEKIMPTLKQIGDISMGNAEKFGSLTLAFAQMSSSGRLMGQDLLQMINAGFNPLSVISQKTGKSIGELKKEMEQGAISVEMVADAFKTATSEGGMFYGMLEKQGEGLAGAIAQLEGAWQEALNTLGERSQDIIVGGIKGVTKLVENFDTLISVVLGVASAFGVYKTVLISVNVVETIAKFNELRKTLQTVEAAQKLLNATTMKNPYILLVSAIVGVSAALLSYASSMNKAKKEQQDFNDAIGDNTKGTLAKLEKMSKEWEKMGNDFQAKEQYIINNKSAFEELGKAVGSVAEAEDLLIKNKDKFKEAIIEKAKAGLYQAKAEELIAKQVENEQEIAKLNPEVTKTRKIKGKFGSYRLEYYKEKNPRIKELEDENAELQKQIDEYLDKAISGESEGDKPTKDYQKINDEITKYTNLIKETSQKIADLRSGKIESTNLLGDIEAEEKKLDEYTKTLETLLGKQEKVTATTFAQKAAEEAHKMENDNFRAQLQHEAELARVRENNLEEYYDKQQSLIDNEYDEKLRNIEKEREEALKNAKKEDKGAINEAFNKQVKEAENTWALQTEQNTQAYEAASYKERLTKFQQFVEEYLRIEQEKEERAKEIRKLQAEGKITEENATQRLETSENAALAEKTALQAELGLTAEEVSTLVAGVVVDTVNLALDQMRNQLPALEADLRRLKEAGADPMLIASLEGQIKTMRKALNDVEKGTTEYTDATAKGAQESKAKWSIVVNSLGTVNDALNEVMNTFGDMMSDSAKTAVNVMQTTLSATMGVVSAIQMASETAVGAIKAAETASVVLAIISAAVQVIMAITKAIMANFSAQAKYEKAMEKYQRELETLQKEHEEIKRGFQDETGMNYWDELSRSVHHYKEEIDAAQRAENKAKENRDRLENKYGKDSKKAQEAQEDVDEATKTTQDIIDAAKEDLKEIFEKMATTDVTSFGEEMANALVDSFTQGLNGMKGAWDDTIKNMIKSMLTQRLALQLTDQFESAFKNLEEATSSKSNGGVEITDYEMQQFLADMENAKAGALKIGEEYKKIFAEMGLLDDTINAESKGVQNITVDQADELTARATAMQISGANIDATLREQLQLNKEGLILVNTIQENVELMTQIATSQLQELRTISMNTALLSDTNNMLKSIKDNTARL